MNIREVIRKAQCATFGLGVLATGSIAACGDSSSASPSAPAPAPAAARAPVASIALVPNSLVLFAGSTGQLVATMLDEHGNVVAATAAWHSSNDAIASVDDAGSVAGKAAGSAFVYATVDGHTDSAAVVVQSGSR